MSKKHRNKSQNNTFKGKSSGGVFKKIGIIAISLVTCICVVLDCWALSVALTGDRKVASKTFEYGLQRTQNGDAKYFCELQFYSNKNKNGVMCLDVKLNYMMDENQERFYSQGMQYVATSPDVDEIKFEAVNRDATDSAHAEIGGAWFWKDENHYRYADRYPTNVSVHNYASSDDYANTIESTKPLSDNPSFKIQLGSDLYLMKFTDRTANSVEDFNKLDSKFIAGHGYDKSNLWENFYTYYSRMNIYEFVYRLYQAIQDETLAYGVDHPMVFEFGDWFDYYSYDGKKEIYTEETRVNDDITKNKILNDIKTYMAIKVTKSEDGITKASQSLFNCVNGKSTYNTSGDYSNMEYFIGRTVIDVTIKDCELVGTAEENKFKIKLSTKFVEFYSQFKDSIVLDINIDTTYYDELGITIDGFTLNGLSGFTAYKNNMEVK